MPSRCSAHDHLRFSGPLIVLVFVILAAATGPVASAQTTSTTILGTVVDASGAVLPGARVTIVNTRTGIKRDSVASSTGDYVFPLVDVGVYDVMVEADGFRPETRRAVLVEINEKVRADFELKLGGTEERVEVTANSSTLRTDDATLGADDRAASRGRAAAEQPEHRRARDPAARRAVRAAQRF